MVLSFGSAESDIFDIEYSRRNLPPISSSQILANTGLTPYQYRDNWISQLVGRGGGFIDLDGMRNRLVTALDQLVIVVAKMREDEARAERERVAAEARQAAQDKLDQEIIANAKRELERAQEEARQVELQRSVSTPTITTTAKLSTTSKTLVAASGNSVPEETSTSTSGGIVGMLASLSSTQKTILLGLAAAVGGIVIFKKR